MREDDYESVVKELAFELGFRASTRAWLDLVRKHYRRPHYLGGWEIHDIHEASAIVCRKLRACALQNKILASILGAVRG
jgi:hypothetical protein